MDTIYLDFAKAFDTVPHQCLLNKLHGYGIREKAYEWIKISSRHQRVVVKGYKSDRAPVTSSIPQGSVLGQLLFVIFIYDLPDITQCITQMFADDTKIFSLVANTEDREKLQMILIIYVFGLTINASKSKVLPIGNRNPDYKYSMESIDGTVQAEEIELDKDLGVYIDPELKVSKHLVWVDPGGYINRHTIF